MKDLKDKFKRAGGAQILRQYLQSHVLGYALVQAALQGTSQKSLEIVRLSVNNKMLGRLRKKNRAYIQEYLEKERAEAGTKHRERTRSQEIWMLWLDGEDKAPVIVKRCIASVRAAFPDRTVHVLTEDNYREYAKFPAFIQEKIDSGQITKTHLSDLLRLELLIRYGGTWIDATVFCTGEAPSYMLDSDLFLFQDLKPGWDGHVQRISSWFLTACTQHPILRLTRALLYNYWYRHTSLVDYYLFHDFFELAIETYPEEWNKVIPCSNAAPHILLLRLFEPYDGTVMDAVKEMTPFHKLTYKFEPEKTQIPGTYYQALLEGQQAGEKE